MVARKDGKMRLGKGFSRGELKEAGVDFKQALRLAIPVDLRRKTRHEENISVLRQHLGLRVPKISKPPKTVEKPPKPEKVKVAEPTPTEEKKKPAKRKKATEISKPSKRGKAVKAPKAERPTPKKASTKRKVAKPKSTEKA